MPIRSWKLTTSYHCMLRALVGDHKNLPRKAAPHLCPLTWLAVVDVCFTAGAGEAGSAEASVAPVSVLAGGTVPAGALNALVDVNFTSLTCAANFNRGLYFKSPQHS